MRFFPAQWPFAMLLACMPLPASAQPRVSDQLMEKIIPIGSWSMPGSPRFPMGLPAGIAPENVVHLSAVIYSDPIGTSAAVFRLDHFLTHKYVGGIDTEQGGMGGALWIDKINNAWTIVVDRGPKTGMHGEGMFSGSGRTLVDGTAVTFTKTKNADGSVYNRGNVRIVYVP